MPRCYYEQGADCGNAYTLDGEQIVNSAGVTSENMTEYADLFEQFKWTFRKNTEGNWIFESIIKVK